MKSCKEYRRQAVKALDGRIFSDTWLLALVAVLIVSAIMGAFAFTIVGYLLVLGPLSVGLAVYILNVVRANQYKNKFDAPVESLKNNFGQSVLLGIMQSVYILLWTLLFIIPGIIKTLSYSMCFYIKADHPDYDWRKCIDESRKMMHGHKMKLFLLQLSFLGWIIVGALCLGIGVLWVQVYMETATAAFYEDLNPKPEVLESSTEESEPFQDLADDGKAE